MLLLPRGGGLALLLAQQSRAQTLVAGSCTGAGAAGTRASPPAPFPVARCIPAARTLPMPASCPGGCSRASLLQLAGVPVPQALCAHRLQCSSSHQLLQDSEKRGLWSWMFSCGGLGLDRAGDQAGHASQGWLNATRGCILRPWVTVAGKELCLGCCWAGLHLGKAALCLGCSLLPFTPYLWAPHTGPAPVLEHPARVEEHTVGAALPSP